MVTSFYLKYRPQNFQDLDSTEAREELQKIFSSGKIPHAFLFSGPRGIGKTSAARIVAKAVNCEKKGKKFEPCNQCPTCISVTNGTNMDVLEMDAASNRGIDDIKELRDKIKLSPAFSKYKVYIIDEVHMLTTEAFNALLKTLEEPPAHALFILCTTDPEKLPKTITSRCQKINFKRATQKEMVDKLKKICQEEGLDFEGKALVSVAKLSDGSFRDANKILERVSLSGKVTEEEVKKTAGILAEFRAEEFLEILSGREIKEALLWINRAAEQGANLRVLTESLLEQLRILLLENFGVAENETGGDINLSMEEVKILINLFSRAYFELKFAVIPQLPLEMVVVEWGENRKLDVGGGKPFGSELRAEPLDRGAGNGKLEGEERKTANFTLSSVVTKWPEILERVKPLNHSVQAFLRATRPLAIDGDFLILEVFYKFHKDQLERDQCRRIFEKAASEVLGSEVKMKCSLSEVPRSPKPLPSLENIPVSNSVDPLPKPSQTWPKSKRVAEGTDDDIIKFAEEIFNKGETIQ